MNSKDFIKWCKENDYKNEIYIVDEEDNEYDVEEISTIMFGQPHLYIKIKKSWSFKRYVLWVST